MGLARRREGWKESSVSRGEAMHDEGRCDFVPSGLDFIYFTSISQRGTTGDVIFQKTAHGPQSGVSCLSTEPRRQQSLAVPQVSWSALFQFSRHSRVDTAFLSLGQRSHFLSTTAQVASV